MIVNPKYERLRSYLRTINVHFEREGREIHSGRNTIKTLRVDDLTLCVKRYAPPSLRGRLACALYKSSKARRAYMAPLLLRERGFESPEPVAFVTYRTGLLKSSSYFICLQSDYRHSMCDVETLPPAERTEVVRAFARFGSDLDETSQKVIRHGETLTRLMVQPPFAPLSLAEQCLILEAAKHHCFDAAGPDARERLLAYLHQEQRPLMQQIELSQQLDEAKTARALRAFDHGKQ